MQTYQTYSGHSALSIRCHLKSGGDCGRVEENIVKKEFDGEKQVHSKYSALESANVISEFMCVIHEIENISLSSDCAVFV